MVFEKSEFLLRYGPNGNTFGQVNATHGKNTMTVTIEKGEYSLDSITEMIDTLVRAKNIAEKE